jgi:hypothetical protein
MKLYKSPTGKIYAYEADGSQDHLIASDFVSITEEEASAIRETEYQEWLAAQPTKEEQIAQLQAYIDALKA